MIAFKLSAAGVCFFGLQDSHTGTQQSVRDEAQSCAELNLSEPREALSGGDKVMKVIWGIILESGC